MNYIKTYENFGYVQQGISIPAGSSSTERTEYDPDRNRPPKSTIYCYIIHKQNPLSASIRTEDGKQLFNVTQNLLDLDIMDNTKDVAGLRTYLIQKKKIQPIDQLKMEGHG